MMKSARRFCVVLVTAPDRKTARGLAQKALASRLAACVNLVPGIESHYWWQGQIEQGREILMILKTTGSKLAGLERLILEEHPYDTPELLVLPLLSGTAKYLDWLAASLASPPT